MAGHYFYDPRPFYGYNGSNGLMPLDELFYGRYEPIPYWMDQRMAPVSAFDDYHKQMTMGSRALPQLQQYAYKRPESRDDIGVDMYRRSPYNFNGVIAPMGYQQQLQSQDDTWVHAMNTSHGHGPQQQGYNMIRNANDQYRQIEGPMMGYMPMNGAMNGSRGMEMPMNVNSVGHTSSQGNNMSSNMGNSMGNNNGSHGNKQIVNASSNQFGNKSAGFGNGGSSNGSYENVKTSSSTSQGGGSSMVSKQGGNQKQQQRYVQDDSSSDDSDDEYANGNNNGVKWASAKNSATAGGPHKHGNTGHQSNFSSSAQKTGSKGNNFGSYDSVSSGQHNMVSNSKSGTGTGHGGLGAKSGNHHGSSSNVTANKTSKLVRFQGDDSSSSDSEDGGYGHNKSKASKASSTKISSHGNHGSSHASSFQSHGHQLQSKQMQYGSSQSKGVELKVPICCDNCERKVKECLEYMDGVESVLCDQWNRKVTVYGNVKPDNVLKRVRRVKKTSELWQQAKQQQQLRVY